MCLWQVVLAEKPLIAEETDLIEPTLLDELICHIASLASVYHKPPSAFVEGRTGLRRALPKVCVCVVSVSIPLSLIFIRYWVLFEYNINVMKPTSIQ